MKVFKKLICVLLIAAISIGGYKLYTEYKSDTAYLKTDGTDNERIRDTLGKFQDAYSDGDFDGLSKCCTSSFSSSLQSGMKIYSLLGGKLISYFTKGILGMDEDTMKSIWSQGTALSPMELDIKKIRYISDTIAEVELDYIEKKGKNTKTERAYIQLRKKDEAWRVDSDFYLQSKV